MSRYGKIESGFWRNQKVRALSERARLLLAYLFSCPHSNASGCFVLPDGYIAADLMWPSETVTKTLSELFRNGFAERDTGTDLLRVIGWFGHNAIENENVAKRVVKDVMALPNCEVRQRLIDELKTLPSAHQTVQQTLLKGLPEPSRNQEPNLTEQEPEHEQRAREGFEKEKPVPSQVREPTPAATLSIEIIKVFNEILPGEIPPDTGYVDVWLGKNFDPKICIAIFRTVLGRQKKRRPLNYYDDAIAEAQAKRIQPLAQEKSPQERRAEHWAALDRLWARDGEIKRKPGFVSEDLLREFIASKTPGDGLDIPQFLDRRATA